MNYFDDEVAEMPKFEAECQDLISHIKQTALNEAREEIESMQSELKSLRKIKENLNNWEKEKAELRAEIEQTKRNAVSQVRKERIRELFEDSLVNAWGVVAEAQPYHCNACNDTQEIIFTDANGEKYRETCQCQFKQKYKYIPSPMVLLKLVDNHGVISRYYVSEERDSGNGEERWVYKDLCDEKPFDKLNKCAPNNIFKSKKRCQEYCDYLNQNKRDKTYG